MRRMMRASAIRGFRLIAAVLCAGAATTCEDLPDSPSGPSNPTTGIVVYDGANFTGLSGHIERDVADLSQYGNGPCRHSVSEDDYSYDWNDCISSIRVSPGTRAIIYVHPNFKGWGVTIDTDVRSLEFVLGPCRRNSVDECVSSIRVMPGS